MARNTRNRVGRPSKGPRENFTVRTLTTKNLNARLEFLAELDGVDVSDLTARFLEDGVIAAERRKGIPQQDSFDLDLKTG